MANESQISKEDEKKLLAAYEILQQYSKSDIPVLRFNCRKAKNELWQALFELDFEFGLIRKELNS